MPDNELDVRELRKPDKHPTADPDHQAHLCPAAPDMANTNDFRADAEPGATGGSLTTEVGESFCATGGLTRAVWDLRWSYL